MAWRGAMQRMAAAGALVVALGASASAQNEAELRVRVAQLELLVQTLAGQVAGLVQRVGELELMLRNLVGPEAYARLTPVPLTAPTLELGPPAPPGAPAAAGGANAAAMAVAVPGALAVTGDPRVDYERAYLALLNGDYAIAETGFRAFLAAYPTDRLAVDAHFWLGESLLSRSIYLAAAEAFLASYNANPRGEKAPDALFKLGVTLVALGQTADGCTTFAMVLREYPGASRTLRQRVQAEQTTARCG